jgi:predicted RNA-binding Zn-ribbon protein involved in translation (DUF1610 family)
LVTRFLFIFIPVYSLLFYRSTSIMAPTAILSKSKRPCPSCKEHTLATNDTLKVDEVINYRCESCGYSFSEDEESRKHNESKQKSSADGPSFQLGSVLLVLMAAAIFAITLSAQQEDRENLRQDNSAQAQLVVSG